jgi:aspartate/methionine/tyrosine aminotransferase
MFQILAACRDLEKEGKRVLHFELGDPDFDTPQPITEACIQSLRSGNTHYMPARGSKDLIEAVRMTTGISRGFIPEPDQVTVTTGANSAIFYALKAICDPGDEVLLPNPYFPSYLAAAIIAGVKTSLYNLSPEHGFTPCVESLKSLANKRTKAILINSPSNPTGTVLLPETIKFICDIAQQHDLFVISDEVYARMIYDEGCTFYSPSTLDACRERTIVINGFSKAFAMTGWRVGVVIAPADVSAKITLLSESIVSCVPGFVQDGARAAILCPSSTTKKMYSHYRRRQLAICSHLASAGLESNYTPQGAMYVFPNISKFSHNSERFAMHLLKSSGIATVPGVYFGSQGESHLRFSCAGSDEDIADLATYFHEAVISYKGD